MASAILAALLPGPLSVRCAPGPGVSLAQATIIEMLLTAAVSLKSDPSDAVDNVNIAGFRGAHARR